MAPGEEYVEISWQSRGNEGEHNARSCATERKPGGNHVGTVRESSENAPDALPGFSKTYRAPFACLPKASPCLPRVLRTHLQKRPEKFLSAKFNVPYLEL